MKVPHIIPYILRDSGGSSRSLQGLVAVQYWLKQAQEHAKAPSADSVGD